MAGLSAAAHAAARGLRVRLLEARGLTGGRATSFRHPASGEWVDNGQHVLMGCYHETFRLLALAGAEGGVSCPRSLSVAFADADGRRTHLRCPPVRSPLGLVLGLVAWRGLPLGDRASALGLAGALRRLRGPGPSAALHRICQPGETAGAWLDRHGQSSLLRERLWNPLALAALNESPDKASAEMFVAVLRGMFGGPAADASIRIPLAPLGEVLADPLVRFIRARGGEVECHSRARVVARDGTGVVVESRGRSRRASTVIVAVPWFHLDAVAVVDEGALAAIKAAAAATSWSPIVTVTLWVDRPVAGAPMLGLPGRHLQWAFETSRPGGVRLSLVASGAGEVVRYADRELVALAMSEVEHVLPLAGARVERTLVLREPRATFSVAPGLPARPGPRTGVPGLYLAGDWTDTGLPATIEGAVLSGRVAVDAVLADTAGAAREARA
jgi:zeta-carotene desaturase